MCKSTWLLLPGVTLCVAAAAAPAAEPAPPRYNTVTLQADAQREVQNDLLNATLFVEVNDATPAAVANAVDKSVNEALRVAKKYKNVRARSGNNQTLPVYLQGEPAPGVARPRRDPPREQGLRSGLRADRQAAVRHAALRHPVHGRAGVAARRRERADHGGHRGVQGARRDREGRPGGRGYKLQNLNVGSVRALPPSRTWPWLEPRPRRKRRHRISRRG